MLFHLTLGPWLLFNSLAYFDGCGTFASSRYLSCFDGFQKPSVESLNRLIFRHAVTEVGRVAQSV